MCWDSQIRTGTVRETQVTVNQSVIISQLRTDFTVPPRAHPSVSSKRETEGWDVSARAHTLAASGRWVAFGPTVPPKTSVWGHAGAGSPSIKDACNTN